ncbi:hypothetical protein BX666DRAFT_1427947 [Dichotomocladium elegans]|nr:hypothetical protein BX666DRAFT_1427947 [Dichotomocladium elegans]
MRRFQRFLLLSPPPFLLPAAMSAAATRLTRISRLTHGINIIQRRTTISVKPTKSPASGALEKKKAKATARIPFEVLVDLAPPMSLFASTIRRHMEKGPSAPSWSLMFEITIAVIRDFLKRSSKRTVEELQQISTAARAPLPLFMEHLQVSIPQAYRIRAGEQMERLLTEEDQFNIRWDWRNDHKCVSEMKGEWLYPSTASRPERTILFLHGGAYYLCSMRLYRQLNSKLAK